MRMLLGAPPAAAGEPAATFAKQDSPDQ